IIQFTSIGLRIRAITDDPGMAEALGVNRKRLLTLVFGCAAGLAALAGALGAPIFAIHPEMGMNILIDSFLVVVLGGLGSLMGSVIGAFFVSLTKSIGGGYFAEWSTAILFLVVAIWAMSLDLMTGYTGMLTFGHAAAFGLGGYAAGYFAREVTSDFLTSLLIAELVILLVALPIGFVATRLSGAAFAIVSLCI